MELLGVLRREHPSSIRELVARTGRAQWDISRDENDLTLDPTGLAEPMAFISGV
jgi:predicted transcriptional regulator